MPGRYLAAFDLHCGFRGGWVAPDRVAAGSEARVHGREHWFASPGRTALMHLGVGTRRIRQADLDLGTGEFGRAVKDKRTYLAADVEYDITLRIRSNLSLRRRPGMRMPGV